MFNEWRYWSHLYEVPIINDSLEKCITREVDRKIKREGETER